MPAEVLVVIPNGTGVTLQNGAHGLALERRAGHRRGRADGHSLKQRYPGRLLVIG